jgi:hypothetical protein
LREAREVVPLPADRPAGRACPVGYQYSPQVFDRSPQFRVHTAYVVGGLYGNREALETILAMARRERDGDILLIFNGDFNWLDVRGGDMAHVNETVLRHVATRGNVEAELATEESNAGCGCAYPDYVDEGVVTRSNAIMARLRATIKALPELRRRLGGLPMTLSIEVAGERVAILHGDPESLAGWNFAVESMPPEGTTSVRRIHDYFRRAGARVFACTHTGLPYAQRFEVEGRPRLVVNKWFGWNAQLRGHVLRRDHADLGARSGAGGQPLRVSARRTTGRRLAGPLRSRSMAAALSS